MNRGKLGKISHADKRPPCDDAFGLSESVAFLGKDAAIEHDRSIRGFQE
jgi:hypothetical protein